MDFDNAKENIQPLASGRNVSLLQASLSQEASQELNAQRKQLELDIKNYSGNDPLEPWYAYICWIEQSYPAGGSNSGLQKVMHKCLTLFEQDERYKQDPRLIKLFIKFMGNQGDQIECYQQMYNSGIGTMLADFYIAWAYSYDLTGNMRKANEIFHLGIECRAEPLEVLKEAHQHFGYTVAQRMLLTEGEETTAVTQELNERRLALRSLHGQKKKNTLTVGSVRTGAAIKSNTPGVVQSCAPSTSRASRNANRQLEVFNDENADFNIPPPIAPAETEESKSSLRSIIDAARNQENLKEPVAWSKPHKHGKIFASTAHHDLAFPIHVDEKALPPIVDPEGNTLKAFKYPPNYKSRNTKQEPWVTPVTIEEEPDTNTLPLYNKCMLYPRPNMEFSPEEYRAYCWFKRRNKKHPFVVRNMPWWSNDVNLGVRRYPNFAKVSKPQPRDELDAFYKVPAVPNLATPLDMIYNEKEQMEYQLEELMAAKWRLKCSVQRGVMDMEETVCLPGEQMPRRKSFFPNMQPGSSRKSIMPTISCVMEEDDEAEEEQNPPRQLPSQVVEKPRLPEPSPAPKIWEDAESEESASSTTKPAPAPAPASAPIGPTGAVATSAAPSTVDDLFVMPPPPTRKIEIFEDDAKPAQGAFFDADETCSTQVFNRFIKSQAVSTPKAVQKQAPVRQFGTLLKEVPGPSTATPALALAAAVPAATTVGEAQAEGVFAPVSPILRKQLSTILETSEHATGATGNGTTKSTLTTTGSTTSSTACTSPSSQATAFMLSHKSEKTTVAESTPGPTRLQRQLVSELSMVGEEPMGGGAAGPTAGNFERLQMWEPNAPSVRLLKSLRFQEDKTETITKPLAFAAFQEDKTETLPKLPATQPDVQNVTKVELQQPLPELLESYDDDDICGLFAKTPPKGNEKNFATPLYAANSKRQCDQDTPDAFKHFSGQATQPKKNSFEGFEDEGYALPVAKNTVNKLSESLMADLSFVPETQQPPVSSRKSQSAAQKKFEIFLDESMPPPPPRSGAPTMAEAQSHAACPSNLTASFMKDLSICPLPQPTPLKKQDAPAKFDIFLDESLPKMPPPPAIGQMDCTLPETQPTVADVQAQSQSKGVAHATASFRDAEIEKRPSPPCTSNSSRSKFATSGTGSKLKFLQDLDKSIAQSSSIPGKDSNDFFELNAATEMFATNLSMIKNSTLLPEANKWSKSKMDKLPAGTTAAEVATTTVATAAPTTLPLPPIVIDEIPDDDRSIYYKTTPLPLKLSNSNWQESSTSSPIKQAFEHRKPNIDESLLNSTLAHKNVNPFSVDIINSLLDSIEFSLYIEKLPNCQLQGHVKRIQPQSLVRVHDEQFEVQNIIGKGAYGSIFKGIHSRTGKKVALKQERPTNYWEYYICLEVHSRLESENMLGAYMNIDYALVGNNSSVYISEFSEYGSLIAVCNKIKKHTTKNMDEYVVMHLCCQLLDIVDHLHALGIIHADIKADNFLLMRPLSMQPNELSLQLIDFGVAIDTKLFPPNQTFDYVHNEDAFKCIEMRTQRRWTYQLDLYGLVDVMHVLLFGRYMEVTERQPGIWMPKTVIPRYFSRQTWESIFRTLLNIRDCRSMPNLQQLRTLLKSELAEKEKYVEAAISKFNLIMQRQD